MYPRGSEWRRWDLHFHTPASYDYQNKSLTNQQIIDQLEANNIRAIAITDHHHIDVTRINELKKLGKGKITIFPGIEFRAELGGKESIHYIGIFSENANVEDIWTDLQAKCGIKPSQIQEKGGHEKIYCDLKDTAKIIHDLGGIVTVHSGGKSNTIENIGNSIEFKRAIKVDLVKESIDVFELGGIEDIDTYNNIVFPNIGLTRPLIICSDNHNITNYIIKKKLWIKADPTFEGLLETFNEPERIYIGDEPPSLIRVRENPTKYIDYIQLKKLDSAKTDDIWFDNIKIEINSELTAIIGNKGKGKSALSDILGLCGNTQNHKYFSFLNKDKFRKLPINLSKEFSAEITWKNGSKDLKILNEDANEGSYEKIKYIPQNFLEALCTNIDKKIFEDELEKVIFSRLDDAEKLGRTTLTEIIDYKKEIIENAIDLNRSSISRLNSIIADLEFKQSEIYLKSIKENLAQKNTELASHLLAKPVEIVSPNSSEEQKQKNAADIQKLSDYRSKIQELNTQKTSLNSEKSILALEIAELKRLKETFSQLQQYIAKTVTDNEIILNKYSLNIAELITYNISFIKIDEQIQLRQARLISIDDMLSESTTKSIQIQIVGLEKSIKDLQDLLDGPNKEYQEYLSILNSWNEQLNKIKGDKNKESSLEYYKYLIEYVDKQLPGALEEKYKQRTEILRELLNHKQEIIAIYQGLYKPVSDFIDQNKNTISEYNVNIDVKLELKDFMTKFFNYVSNGKAGSFCGSEDGRIMLNNLIQNTNFSNEESIINWVQSIVDYMHYDKRPGFNNAKKILKDELKGGNSETDFYDFLYSLEYLDPTYQLKLGNKELSELSPGERGALLLIFYLLLDKDDIPIIIDQPEENLDNQSVYKILVPFIKQAKLRRQIIIVTHNPNLAVVCDAEQIIKTEINKTNKNEFTFQSGSIESKIINDNLIDVLEGTMPALANRNYKYNIFKR